MLPPEILLRICDYIDLKTRLKMRLIHKICSPIEFIYEVNKRTFTNRGNPINNITFKKFSTLYEALLCLKSGSRYNQKSIAIAYSFKGWKNRYVCMRQDFQAFHCSSCASQDELNSESESESVQASINSESESESE